MVFAGSLRWLILLTALAAPGVTVTAAAEPPPTESITISGATGGYADIVLTKQAHFDFGMKGLQVAGGRKFVGFCMQAWKLADRPRGIPCGARLNVVDDQWLMGAGIWADLRPGKYRVYLLADGPAKATIPMKGLGRRLLLTAGGRAPRGTVTLTDATGPGGLEAGRWRERMNIKDNGANWTGWHFISDTPLRAQFFDMCLAPVGGECLLVANTFGDGRAVSFGGPVVGGPGGMGMAAASGPDHDRNYQGSYDVMLANVATAVDVRALGFSLDIDFSPGPPPIP